ncbi:MAG: hypothetical protein OEM82_10120 [Acidobacteriota bacterium]|nr:hypothetical protein [Acidobacteriota bacterium]MDH3531156.1 hypothetical protein [Acidobacteriota bacterium]
MDLTIFIVGFVVTMSVIYGIFSQVPLEMAPPEEIVIKAPEKNS